MHFNPLRLARSLKFRASEHSGKSVMVKVMNSMNEKLPPKPEGCTRLATLCGSTGIPLLKSMLTSLYHASAELPTLTIIEDVPGAISKSNGWSDFWPTKVDFLTPYEVAAFWDSRGDRLLSQCALGHIFGLKIAATQMIALRGSVLYCDSDVLWFADPSRLTEKYGGEGICLCEDFCASYNEQLLAAFSDQFEEAWLAPPYCNAGVMLIPECGGLDIVALSMLEWVVEGTGYHQNRWGNFGNSEQTTLAMQARRSGRVMDSTDVFCQAIERTIIAPSFVGKPWICRHYVSPVRRQLYIDLAGLSRTWKKL